MLILDISPLIPFILTLKEALEAKLVILDISFLTSFTLALRVVLVASYKLVISSILSSIFLIVGLYRSFITISFFTTSPSLLKSAGTGFKLSPSNLDNLFISN